MIDNFLGIDTEGRGGVGVEGGTLDTGYCHRMWHAVMIFYDLFFFKDRSILQYFITQGMGQSSMFLTFHTMCNFRGRTSALGRVGGRKGGITGRLHTCLL